MTWLTTKELYQIFLQCDWWLRLSDWNKRLCGECEQCGRKDHLQSHHTVYRESWFDTRIEDLECLCDGCHERRHKIGTDGIEDTPIPDHAFTKPSPSRVVHDLSTIEGLLNARSAGEITRQRFIQLRQMVQGYAGRRIKIRTPRRRRGSRKRSKPFSYKELKVWKKYAPVFSRI